MLERTPCLKRQRPHHKEKLENKPTVFTDLESTVMAVLRSRHTASPSGLGVPDAHLLGCFAQSLYVLFLVYFYFPKCVNTVPVSKGQVTFPGATNCPEQMPKSVLTFNVEIS